MQTLIKDLLTDEYNFPKLNKRQDEALDILADPDIRYMLLRGGSRSGKTYFIADYMIKRAMYYPGSKHIVLRRTKTDCAATVWLEAFLPVLEDLEELGICKVFKSPHCAVFANGSRITIGGLAPNELDKVLGIEYATIFISEATEVTHRSFEALKTRLNDRSKHHSGRKSVKPVLLCDCNPGSKGHWLYKVFIKKQDPETGEPLKDSKRYAELKFLPKHNKANLAEGYIDTLEGLSGHRRTRFLLGDFSVVEGAIFPEFDPSRHILYTEGDIWLPTLEQYQLVRSLDFGWNHPTACLWGAWDHSNEKLIIYREYRKSHLTATENASNILDYSIADLPTPDQLNATERAIWQNRVYSNTLCDHQSEYRNQFEEAGYQLDPADKSVQKSIDFVKELLNSDKLLISRCPMLIEELEGYRWKDNKDKELEDEPVKKDDDLVDCLRYMANHFIQPGLEAIY